MSQSIPNTTKCTYEKRFLNGEARLVSGERRRKKEKKSNYGTCIGAGPRWDAHAGNVPRVFDRMVLDEVPLLAAVCAAALYAPRSRPLGRYTPSDAIERLSIVGVVQGG